MLVALDVSGSRKVASESLRGGDFNCPDCLQSVHVRTGEKRVAHFAHLVGQACTQAKVEAARRRNNALKRTKKLIQKQELLGQGCLFDQEEILD